MLSKFKLNQLYFKDTQFANLMTRRIFNVLLIANPYDAFMLEDDGRIRQKRGLAGCIIAQKTPVCKRWGTESGTAKKEGRKFC